MIKFKGWRTWIANGLMSIVPLLEMTEIRDVIPDEYMPYYALGMVIANMLLRYVTTTPVGVGK